MADAKLSNDKGFEKFMNEWRRHPISLSIVTIVITLSFIIIMLHGNIDADGVKLALYTYIFSTSILIIIYTILLFKKNVLYNTLDQIMNEIDHRTHLLLESLSDIEIKIDEPYGELLDRLSPKTAKHPITSQARTSVVILEFLIHLQEHCGIRAEIDDQANLALAKYYYKERKYERALNKLNTIKHSIADKNDDYHTTKKNDKTVNPAEVSFLKALSLSSLGRENESVKYFKSAETENKFARCIPCTKVIDSGYLNVTDLDTFIDKTQSCPHVQSTVFCLNRLATAYNKKAKFFSDEESRKKNLRKAIEKVNIAIAIFNSWTAYYNKACYMSIMASLQISPQDDQSYNATCEEELKRHIFDCLKAAFNQKPALILHSKTDLDLNWVRKNHAAEFNALVGATFNNASIL